MAVFFNKKHHDSNVASSDLYNTDSYCHCTIYDTCRYERIDQM